MDNQRNEAPTISKFWSCYQKFLFQTITIFPEWDLLNEV